MRYVSAGFVIAASVAVVSAAFPVYAQTATYTQPPDTLAEAIQRAPDNKRRRVPILVVAADTTRRVGAWSWNAAEPPAPLREAIQPFGRQLQTCGSVQVIAPIYQIRPRTDLGPVEQWAKIGREAAARLLMCSLSEAQWHIAAQGDGLALSDLGGNDQREWFRTLLPDPFVLYRAAATNSPSITSSQGNTPPPPDMPETVTVTPDQVRLRLRRTMSWTYQRAEGDGFSYSNVDLPGDRMVRTPGTYFYQLRYDPAKILPDYPAQRLWDEVRQKQENRLKHSALVFNAPPLAGRTIALGGAETVGAAVQRIAEATGLELYADRRIAGLRLQRFGEETAAQVDAGDLLKALCYALAATVRSVDDPATQAKVYLLTADEQGQMMTELALAEWVADMQALAGSEKRERVRELRDRKNTVSIAFAADDQMTIADSAMRSAEATIADPDKPQAGYGVRVPITALSPGAQQQVKHDLYRPDGTLRDGTGWDDKNVYATFEVGTQLVVPGYGTYPGPALSDLNDLLVKKPAPPPPPAVKTMVPAALPAPLQKFAALQVTLQKDEEVEKAVVWARRHGFNALFVATSLWNGDDQPRLIRTAALGKQHGIAVYPVVSVLRVPEVKPEERESAPWAKLATVRNVRQETLRTFAIRRKDAPAIKADADRTRQLQAHTSDWFDVTDEPTRTAIAARIHALAQQNGITGMVFSDVSAPGMALTIRNSDPATLYGIYGTYNDALRVAAIRKLNRDPLDISPAQGILIGGGTGEDALTPFFPQGYDGDGAAGRTPIYRRDASGMWSTEQTPAPDQDSWTNQTSVDWNTLRREANQSAVAQLCKAADLPAPLPVYVAAPDDVVENRGRGWIAFWTDRTRLPMEAGDASLLPFTVLPTATPEGMSALINQSLPRRMTKKRMPDGTTHVLEQGVRIDISRMPLERGLALLASLKTVP